MEKYCPQIQKVCKDGYPYLESYACMLWDEENGVCLFAENMMNSNTVIRAQKFASETKLDKILKDVDLEGDKSK